MSTNRYNFTFSEEGGTMLIFHNHTRITKRTLMDEFSISKTWLTVNITLKNLKNKVDMCAMLNDYIYKKDHNISVQAILYKKGAEVVIAKEVVKSTGLSNARAVALISKWQAGELTKEQLLSRDFNKNPIHNIASNWKGLSSTLRDHNLLKIPSPSKQEKEHCTGGVQKLQMFGDHTGNKRY